MDNEQQSNPEGHDEGRANSSDSQGGAEVVHAGDSSTAPDESLGNGGRQPAQSDGQGIDLNAIAIAARSGPLPSVEEYAGYERVLPGAADRILAMAEKSLDIEISDRKAATAMEAADHKAENLSMLITSVAFSFLPWMAFGAAIVCAAFGNNVGTFIGSIVGVFSAGPQLIDAVKRKRK